MYREKKRKLTWQEAKEASGGLIIVLILITLGQGCD